MSIGVHSPIIRLPDGSECDANWADPEDHVRVYIERPDGHGSWVESPVIVGEHEPQRAAELAHDWAAGIDWGAETLDCDEVIEFEFDDDED